MSNLPSKRRERWRIGLSWFALFLGLQLVALAGQYKALEEATHQALDKVERRVSLDSAYLDVGNNILDTPVNEYAIKRYLDRINSALSEKSYPVRVYSMQNVTTRHSIPAQFNASVTKVFENAEQRIEIEMRRKSITTALTFSWSAFILALLIAPIYMTSSRKRTQKVPATPLPEAPPLPQLIINLEQKTISNGVDDKAITLQNKPLCFYTALVRFCIDNPSVPLSPHKDVPNELITLANKSFGRLIELGHTKRKRPDFNANLDKTLSEIRAALDDVFSSFPQEKEIYCPPRAQGEGSRSKQHSYALSKLKQDDVIIIGN